MFQPHNGTRKSEGTDEICRLILPVLPLAQHSYCPPRPAGGIKIQSLQENYMDKMLQTLNSIE
jgi:hypothetical protein